MTKEKILSIVQMYREQFEEWGIPKVRMSPKQALGSLTSEERLAHAHFILDGIEEYAKDPAQAGKTGRHLAL